MAMQPSSWQEDLATIDRVMKAISGVSDPEELVSIYWAGVGKFIPSKHFVAVSRRGVDPPAYLVTRSSRFIERHNPWTQRDRLPRLAGGVLGQVAYAGEPVIIEDLPARLEADDPAHFYLQGFQSLVSTPQYDGGEALNCTIMLLPPGQEIDRAMLPMLHWQAGLFGRGTQNLVLRNQLAAANAELDREMAIVGEIQRALLPQGLPRVDGFEIAAHYQPCTQAGGDYYDFFPLEDGCLGILVADVSGHGTPAAVLMAITRAIVHTQAHLHGSPAALLRSLNAQRARSYPAGEGFVTVFYGVLDPVRRSFTYSCAGQNPPRLARGERVIQLDQGSGVPVGILDDYTYREATLELERGDLLLFYTDGITEAMAPQDGSEMTPLFGEERLDALLVGLRQAAAAECLRRIRDAVEAFSAGEPIADDQTMVALRCL